MVRCPPSLPWLPLLFSPLTDMSPNKPLCTCHPVLESALQKIWINPRSLPSPGHGTTLWLLKLCNIHGPLTMRTVGQQVPFLTMPRTPKSTLREFTTPGPRPHPPTLTPRGGEGIKPRCFVFRVFFFFFFFFFFFGLFVVLGPHLQYMEIPRLGV